MILTAGKYAEVKKRGALGSRGAARGYARPTAPALFIPTITGARDRVKLGEWYFRELKEGGFLHNYLGSEKRKMPHAIRCIARIMDGFEQNNKSDFRRLAAVPARLYHRWKAEDEHFFDDNSNLRSLKRDNPDLPVYVGARQMPRSARVRKKYGEHQTSNIERPTSKAGETPAVPGTEGIA